MTIAPEAPETDLARLPLSPGSACLPVIGESLAFLRSTTDFTDRRRAAYGPIFRTYILGSPSVFPAGPEANRWIFAGEDRSFQKRWSAGIRQLLGPQCLAMLNGEAHRAHRLLMSHFSQQAMHRSGWRRTALTTGRSCANCRDMRAVIERIGGVAQGRSL
jgi:cytochrome P450